MQLTELVYMFLKVVNTEFTNGRCCHNYAVRKTENQATLIDTEPLYGQS